MKKIFVTTSWDDGHKLDLKVSELLTKYGLTGTFYVATNQVNRLNDDDIREISKRHEIGAHTVNHPRLSAISIDKAAEEIKNSKTILENIVGKPVEMFAYPFGDYNEEVKCIVGSCGFRGARTTKDWSWDLPEDAFEMPTSLHVYPHPLRPGVSSLRARLKPLFYNFPKIIHHRLRPAAIFSWRNLALAMFDRAYAEGSVFHIWGHSWEIEKYGMWNDFEDLLKYISSHVGIVYSTNRDIIRASLDKK
ncbi:MAG: polysaccharide deacetylase [Parcubacteria group bacterium GW2011_GWC1_43_61]|uniref:Polysaccharide deacetylase n=1 Tax=Candidatus Shapirobacteria bacterium GW2011_GWE1_38_92 TaxID=1618489 RepID=A0A0G0LP64_9BACT|nr:MAG: Polysaccharide deacetylase [Candidatus Shapirobacteria bacterium GW2011_GWE1_38_92]KKR85389.1 MAG: Polysaccharide deacetylase [Candidatus Azambacteria bacterium GW2011_GWF1_41_10]KKS49015.1 MAG: Polysaccharide deacetylase [Candidatus Azambacteria bacterium GW2011_GWF2_42_22]KKS68945.1 MAG: Polysaccharide deacetylase [Candidatus Azambacteria bacterium GW2011_GWA2_42_62]KKS73720.1 MAG: Polysaccharide deacetylase [Candidatus Azambacteria bacterium GW2011_GWB1_42_72]KKT03175.1 MAG: Polysac